jgi:hypothetical protein
MTTRERAMWALFIGLALVAHVDQTLLLWRMLERFGGADFSSFYYGFQAAALGLDPYDAELVAMLGAADGVDASIHPYFYPPPFLLVMAPWSLLTFDAAYRSWFFVDTGLMVLATGLLAAVLRGEGPRIPWVVVLAVLSLTASANNHPMGQMNWLCLTLVLGGVWAERRGRPALGGALVGAAALVKVTPVLFVLWWALRGRYRAAAAAIGAAVAGSVATAVILPWRVTWRFWSDVLWGLGSGDYNGLLVPIGLFGNHSMPDWFHRVWPGGETELSTPAAWASRAFGVAVLASLAVFWKRAPEQSSNAEFAALAVAMLLVPVYTWEHHLIWALPAMVLTFHAVLVRRLSPWWLALLVPADVFLSYELRNLRVTGTAIADTAPWAATLLRESKTLGLFALLAASMRLATRPSAAE